MMKVASKFDFRVLSYSQVGSVNVMIDGKEYIYFVDAVYIPNFLKRNERSDGRALDYLKKRSRGFHCLTPRQDDQEVGRG